MSQSLRSMDNEDRRIAIQRRIKMCAVDKKTGLVSGGLGYWGAVDAKANHKA